MYTEWGASRGCSPEAEKLEIYLENEQGERSTNCQARKGSVDEPRCFWLFGFPAPADVLFYFTREAEVKEIGRPRGTPPARCRGPPRSPTTAHISPCCGPCLGRDCHAWKRFQRLLEESNPATEETPVHRAVSLLVIREEAARQTSPAEWESFRVSSEALDKTDKRPWVLIYRRRSRDRAGHSRKRGRGRWNAPPFSVPLVGHIPPRARLISAFTFGAGGAAGHALSFPPCLTGETHLAWQHGTSMGPRGEWAQANEHNTIKMHLVRISVWEKQWSLLPLRKPDP